METVTCDVCGKSIGNPATRTIALGSERWELDLCETDLKRVISQVKAWTANARVSSVRSARRRPASQARDEWDYLESLGFRRHRGRKSAEEIAALKGRKALLG